MALEAQRLIAMSMGKIHAARSQRGGINLHKNLLVATVIHKAKTVYMMENYQSLMESQKAQQAEQTMDTAGDNVQNEPTHASDHEALRGVNGEASEGGNNLVADNHSSCGSEDKENSPPISDNVSSCALQYHQSESPLQTQNDCAKDSNKTKDPNCVRCVKRRMTESDYSQNQLSYSVPTSPSKKAKFDSDLSSDSTQDQQCQTDPSPMTPSKQICNLVNSFSSGFTGLLSGSLTATSNSSHEDSQEDNVYYSDSVTQGSQTGHSSENSSLISCSTQIKEAFETLTRPIIALTV